MAARDFGSYSVSLLDYGWAGVDFFFVLSGFIIAWSAPGKTAKDFAWHRVRRVVLPYLPIGIGVALLYTLLPTVSAGDREWSWLTTLTLFPINSGPALSVAWTLQHEMLFYAVFLLSYFSGRFVLGLSIWAFAIGLACLFGVDWLIVHPINLEFLFGVAACSAVRRGFGDWRFFALALLPLALWIFLGAERDTSVLFGLSIALSIPPIVLADKQRKFRVPAVLTFLGATSYSVYLAHGLAISIGARVLPDLIALTLIGIAGGLAYFYAIERPVMRLTSDRRRLQH